MPTQGETRDVQIQVQSCTPIQEEGKDKQWRVEFIAPSISQFPQKSWMPRSEGQEPLKPITYNVILQCGKRKKDAKDEKDWSYYWDIVQTHSNVQPKSEQPAAPYTSATTADGQKAPRTADQRIQRQVAFKGALEGAAVIYEPGVAKGEMDPGTYARALVDLVRNLTDAFDLILSRTPSAKALEDEPPIRDEEPPEDVIDESQENLPW